MSDIAIQRFLNELSELKHRSGKPNESSIRLAFIKLLGEYAKAKDLRLVPGVPVKGKLGKNVTPDGTLKDTLVMDWGYWESKDEFDDLEREIAGKFAKGYPDDNILFEDSTYAVLHHPAYRSKYELNLKRSFPRIPYYDGFRTWAGWGKELMELHIGFETVEPYPLARIDTKLDIIGSPKAKLKADKEHNIIILDKITSLTGIPDIAWDYKLGNRSALEWILDQYKEKKPKDPTIAKLFNTYRFADYKEKVIDLIMRVCTVSVKTMEIVQQMDSTK